MAQLLPSAPSVEPPEADSRVLSIEHEGDTAGKTFEALSSSTARVVMLALYEDPAPASKISDRIDSSLQNVHYHLERLQQANLVEVVETGYSSKGREMKIYAPASDPLIITAGDSDGEVANVVSGL